MSVKWLEIEMGSGLTANRVFVRQDAVIAVGGIVPGQAWVPVTLVTGEVIRAYCFPGVDDHEPAGFGVLLDALDVEMVGDWTAEGMVPGGEVER